MIMWTFWVLVIIIYLKGYQCFFLALIICPRLGNFVIYITLQGFIIVEHLNSVLCREYYGGVCFTIDTVVSQLCGSRIHLQRKRFWSPRKVVVEYWRNTNNTFSNPEPVLRNFGGCHAMVNYNSLQCVNIPIGGTRGTEWWPHRSMTWLLGITKVNLNLSQAS